MKRLNLLCMVGLVAASTAVLPQMVSGQVAPTPKKAGQPAKEKTKVKPKPDYRKLYKGKKAQEAGDALLTEALKKARDNWDKLSAARVYYLSGKKGRGEAIIQKVTASNADADDWLQIGHIYYEAGEWDKAQTAFKRVLEIEPADPDYLMDIASYYLLKGERERAEVLLEKVFGPGEPEAGYLLKVGAAYLGVKPQ